LTGRIRVLDNHDSIYFYYSQIYKDAFIDIKSIILEAACQIGSLKILEFIYEKGITLKLSPTQASCSRKLFYGHTLSKTLSLEECKIVEKLSNGPDSERLVLIIRKLDVLYYCCVHGTVEKLNYFYPLFQHYLNREDLLLKLSKACIEYEQYHMIRVLNSYGLFVSDNRIHFESLCSTSSIRYLLDDAERLIANTQEAEKLEELCLKLLLWAFRKNDLVGVKYIFSKHRFESFLDHEMLFLQNPAIIEYINKNRSLCFTAQSSFANTGDLFSDTLYKELPYRYRINPPLMKYLIQEKCINLNKFTCEYKNYLEGFFSLNDQSTNQELIYQFPRFCEFVYLVDHKNYSSIDPFINILIDDKNRCNSDRYLEYIYRNQHKFQNKPSFQSAFDHMIINFNENKLKQSSHLLHTLIFKYKCVLNDSHYHYLVKYNDGVTLFGIISKYIKKSKWRLKLTFQKVTKKRGRKPNNPLLLRITLKKNFKQKQIRQRKQRKTKEKLQVVEKHPLDDLQIEAGYSRIKNNDGTFKFSIIKKKIEDPIDLGLDYDDETSTAPNIEGSITFQSSHQLSLFCFNINLEEFLHMCQFLLYNRLFSTDNKDIQGLFIGTIPQSLFVYHFSQLK
ncbi:hypothetical protein CYY_010153, partial [Polysphondylium violaceum]